MDRPHARSPSSPPSLSSVQASFQQSHRASPEFDVTNDIFDTEVSPSRQQRLLQNRNARFPAKKLSISSLSSKLTQLIGKTDSFEEPAKPSRNQENRLHKSRSTGTIGRRGGLGILEEISSTARGRNSRQHPNIPIYEDNPARPLLETSPPTSSPYAYPTAEFTSPLGFDNIQDSLSTMRLKDRSISEAWSPMYKSSPSIKLKTRPRSGQTQWDAENYIEHIEKELQQAREEAYSPLTRRPMKEKLRVANKENARLHKELATLKERFETEVKRTVEHKMMAELELKRKVRDLEDCLEEKENTIREMQYQHEERRLDNNVFESLKANIERLEQEKQDMEEINLSMSKRNEVLTQLLAMSPTKTATGFNLGSPVREKINARPMSLILPRIPRSPRQLSQASSVACSPQPLSTADISPFKLSPEQSHTYFSDEPAKLERTTTNPDLDRADRTLRSPRLHETASRRWTLFSDVSASSNPAAEEPRPAARRKPRRFVAGSTQLKPLLLPALNGDTMPSASTLSSPRSWPSMPDSEVDEDETALPVEQNIRYHDPQEMPEDSVAKLEEAPSTEVEGPGPAYDNAPVTEQSSTEDCVSDTDPYWESTTARSRPRPNIGKSRRSHMACASLQTMPMPSTPDSLAALPAPLFSPVHKEWTTAKQDLTWRTESPPLAVMSAGRVKLRKRRKTSLEGLGWDSPVSKISRQRVRHSSVHHISPSPAPSSNLTRRSSPIKPQTLHQQLQNVRSSDNFIELLRQKNFAVKPLAAMTIKTIFKLIATCTKGVRDFRQDPFALARKVLANAWYMNWNMMGKLSWYVLGLFIHPRKQPRARPPIDWDQYDGESIASRYCNSVDDEEQTRESLIVHSSGEDAHSHKPDFDKIDALPTAEPEKTGWGKSLFLWGKFSAAMMLAVSGAVIKGPGEMLKDVPKQSTDAKPCYRLCKSCGAIEASSPFRSTESQRQVPRGPQSVLPHEGTRRSTILGDRYEADFDFRSDTQLDSSSLLDQIQQTGYDSTMRPSASPRKRLDSLFSPTRMSHSDLHHASNLEATDLTFHQQALQSFQKTQSQSFES